VLVQLYAQHVFLCVLPRFLRGVFFNLARVELATLQTAKFTSLFASKLEIRWYVCVFRLRRYENFARFKFIEVCAAAFFQMARHEFAGRLTPFKNECK